MKIDRSLYKNCIEKRDMGNWSCSKCNKGHFKIIEKTLLIESDERIDFDPVYDNPNDIIYMYSVFLKCTNINCNEKISSLGTLTEDSYEDYNARGEREDYHNEYFTPNFFYPSLHIFKIPDNTPQDVKDKVIQSFSTFFSDNASSANSIRIALECIVNTINKRTELTRLNKKIENLDTEYSEIKDKCEALKWLGNNGSHCDDKKMTRDDVLDGYDILSFILTKLYDDSLSHINTITQTLNEDKGIPQR